MSLIRNWFTVAASNTATSPDGEPEGMQRSGVNNSARERAASIKTFYDNPDFRRPFEDYTLARVSSTIFTLTDDLIEADASLALEVDQRLRLEGTGGEAGKFWEGFITAVVQSPATVCTVTVAIWDTADSEDAVGPLLAPAYIQVGPKELGTAAWANTGTAATQAPLNSDLEGHTQTPEANLDVGFLDGETREEISIAAARVRLNANGGCGVWQRGTSFTAVDSLNDDENLCADNFVIISDGDDRVDVTRSTDVPVNVPVQYSIQMSAQPTSNEKHGLVHIVELADGLDVGIAGTTNKISMSFWAKVGAVAGIDQLRAAVLVLKNATPTTHPVSVWGSGSQGVLTFNSTDWQLVTGQTPDGDLAVSMTGVWAEFKIEGLDLDIGGSGSGVGPIALVLTADESVIATNMSWHATAFQANRGDKALPFIHVPEALERERCYRYYEKTLPEATTPAHNAGLSGALCQYPTGPVAGTGHLHQSWRFRAEKYKTPTILTYNPIEAVPSTSHWGAITEDLVPIVSNIGTASADFSVTAGSANNEDEVYSIHAAAHANVWGAS